MDGTNSGVFGALLEMNGANTEGLGGVAAGASAIAGPAPVLKREFGVISPCTASKEGGSPANMLEDAAPDAVGVVGPGAGASSMRRGRFADGVAGPSPVL